MCDAIMNQIPAFFTFPFARHQRQISQPISSLLSWMIFLIYAPTSFVFRISVLLMRDEFCDQWTIETCQITNVNEKLPCMSE